MDDIVVSILSRDGAERVINTVELMYDSCADPSSFSVHLVIDDDQVELYQPVLKRYPDIRVGIVPHVEGTLIQCFIKQFEMFLDSGRYFFLLLADDMLAAIHHWDRYIMAKKDYFKDGVFSLYSTCLECYRTPYALKRAYVLSKDSSYGKRAVERAVRFKDLDPIKNEEDFDLLCVYEYGELFPVYARNFCKYVLQAFKELGSSALGPDIVSASLLQQLTKLTGQNRLVYAFPDNFRHINNEYFEDMIQKWLDSKKSCLYMRIIKQLAKKMAEDIYANCYGAAQFNYV